MMSRLIFGISLSYFLICPAISYTQTFRNQQGFFLGGGVSQPGRYSRFLESNPEPGTQQDAAICWEAGLMVIRKISQRAAFSQGISILMLGNSIRRNREIWLNSQQDSILFAANQQRIENYFVTFPFRWSFYLNKHRGGQWFIGPGISMAIPVYESRKIKGTDLQGVSRELNSRGWPKMGPYAFLCPELETGFMMEFPDCSLLRISLFGCLRGIDVFKGENNYTLQYFSGLRFVWFRGTD